MYICTWQLQSWLWMTYTNNVKTHALFLIFNTVDSFHVRILNITIYLIVYIAQSKCIRKESRVIAAVHAIAAVTLQLPILQLSNTSPPHCLS